MTGTGILKIEIRARRRRGFSAVFLTLILGAMVTMTLVFVHGAAQKAGESIHDSVLRLAGLSVLGEYDLDLYQRYHILAHGKNEEEISQLIQMYGNETFRNKRPMDLIRSDLQAVEVSLKKYSLMDGERLEKELSEIMVYRIAREKIRSPEVKKPDSERPQRELKNQKVISTLPSGGKDNWTLLTQAITNLSPNALEGLITRGHRYYLVNEYIQYYFSHDKEGKSSEHPAFFRNETEYLLYGDFSDTENKKRFLNDFTGLRTGLNLYHIIQDPEKMQELSTLANLTAPGPGAPAAQGVLASAWAFSEALNDRKILDGGGKVPILKKKENWALSIENLHRQEGGVLYPAVQEGKNYGEYLELFLYFANHEKKLLRIMDLIQINMKTQTDSRFTMAGRYKGFEFTAFLNGKAYHYEKSY